MQKIHNFLQCFLGFFFPCHILKLDAGSRRHIHLGVGFAKLHHRPAHPAPAHAFHQHLPDEEKQYHRQHPAHQKGKQGVHFLFHHLAKGAAGSIQPVHQTVIIKGQCSENFRFFFCSLHKINIFLVHLYHHDFFGIQAAQKRTVVHFGNSGFHDGGQNQHIGQKQNADYHQIKNDQRLSGIFLYLHFSFSSVFNWPGLQNARHAPFIFC